MKHYSTTCTRKKRKQFFRQRKTSSLNIKNIRSPPATTYIACSEQPTGQLLAPRLLVSRIYEGKSLFTTISSHMLASQLACFDQLASQLALCTCLACLSAGLTNFPHSGSSLFPSQLLPFFFPSFLLSPPPPSFTDHAQSHSQLYSGVLTAWSGQATSQSYLDEKEKGKIEQEKFPAQNQFSFFCFFS